MSSYSALRKYSDLFTLSSATESFRGEIVVDGNGAVDWLNINNYTMSDYVKYGAILDNKSFSLSSISGVGNAQESGDIAETVRFSSKTADASHIYQASKLAIGDVLSSILDRETPSDEALNSLLFGGDDNITGTRGADILYGGGGYDTFRGSAGGDTFAFYAGDSAIDAARRKFDTLGDFKSFEGDKIQLDLNRIDFVSRESVPMSTLALAHTDANARMAQGANTVFEKVGKDGYLFIDYDGDHIADSVIKLIGVKSLGASALTLSPDTAAPLFVSDSIAPAIDENSGAGRIVYTAEATDVSTITYSLKNTDDFNLLCINATTGAVTLMANPDYETKNTYAFTVIATDSADNASDQAVTFAINNLDEAEAALVFTNGVAAAENIPTDTVVYDAQANNDIGVTYSFLTTGGGDHALFNLDSTTGEVTFKTSPDY